MRPLDDKECYGYTADGGAAANGRPHRKNPASRAKPTPSKWDDAQKWLVGMSHGGRADGVPGGVGMAKPRGSNADDRRLLGSSSQNGRVSCSSIDGVLEYGMVAVAPPTPPQLAEFGGGERDADDDEDVAGQQTKRMTERVAVPQQQHDHGSPVVRSVCLRDMGTEMTPIASKEPSRTATPLRATTPVARSPIESRSNTPVRRRHEEPPMGVVTTAAAGTAEPVAVAGGASRGGCDGRADEDCRATGASSLEARAAAWDEAERAKFTARYKREEVRIQAWENHEKRKAEAEIKKMQMKADQMKARAQEKLANRLAATRRTAEQKRASAEAKLNESAARTSEKANYIRRTGHLPSSFFSFKMPSLCG